MPLIAGTISTSSNAGPTSEDLIIDKKKSSLFSSLENEQTTSSNSNE